MTELVIKLTLTFTCEYELWVQTNYWHL